MQRACAALSLLAASGWLPLVLGSLQSMRIAVDASGWSDADLRVADVEFRDRLRLFLTFLWWLFLLRLLRRFLW